MFLPPRIVTVIAAVFIAAVAAVAGDKNPSHVSIAGTVIGGDGKPLGGAEIRALRVDTKGPVTIATTNSRGLYMLKSLPVGAYSLTACFQGFELSRANITTRGVAWAKVDFDFRLDAGDSVDRMQKGLYTPTIVSGVLGNPH
jgi:hypothetical protein